MHRVICTNCQFATNDPDGPEQAGTICPSCWAGKLRTDRPMPWDGPERLAFYGVDREAYGNRERRETVEIDADGDLTVSGYWR